MKIYRQELKEIHISDDAVRIACELYNKHMIDREYLSIPQYDDIPKERKPFLLIEKVSMVIDDVIESMNTSSKNCIGGLGI
ncbi:hypothetical protein LCGC14_0426740 [marine sediment metagenome]|uniref:Uncharacterized protein n=1 Tax=marine sediment metagenome TaxID=412755 RepID=A0A0F9VBG7_9ZZZZ